MTIWEIRVYIYFALKKPDLLRSEKYSIQKMAIERGLFGDDKVGLRQATVAEALDGPSEEQSKEKENG